MTKLILILFVLFGYLSFTKNVNGSVGLNHSKIQSDDSTYIDSIHLVESKNGKGFKYTPTQKEVLVYFSSKYWLNPIWTPSDSIILEFEDSLSSLIKGNSRIYFAKPINEYIRQYIGLTDTSGNKILLIVFIWSEYSKHPAFGILSNYNSQLHIVHISEPGLNMILRFDINTRRLVYN